MVKTLPLWSSRDWVPEIWEQRRIEKFPYSKVLRERCQSNPIFNYSLNLRNPTRRTAHRMSHLRSNQSYSLVSYPAASGKPRKRQSVCIFGLREAVWKQWNVSLIISAATNKDPVAYESQDGSYGTKSEPTQARWLWEARNLKPWTRYYHKT